ncbi:MAG: ferredoxin [Chloracidobacterium sp.]|nr:ferredoxin [Chloracidobacterium sp.]MDW8218110.1 ferredoxin [Acidobacteriota bacterium]
MANLRERFPENAEGPFYVDAQCIDCDVCRSIAPDIFARNDRGAYSYVLRQPENEEERELCLEAMESCPVEAIGDDGDM